jgi:hypothetical protein
MPPHCQQALSLPADRRQSPTAFAVALGVRRLLAGHGFVSVPEFTLASGRRTDILALGPDGTIWTVEIKSSLADFRTDGKWPDYRDFCDRFFFAVPVDFPTEVLPLDTGLMRADAHGAAIVREAPEHRLAAARRKALILRFAYAAAGRLHRIADPNGAGGVSELG